MSEVNDNRAFGKQNNVNRGYDGVGLLDNNKYHTIWHLLNNNKNKMIEIRCLGKGYYPFT